ncbi:TPA_asm: M [Justicia betacytorhabdovirus 1]|nr:TPA_asm: M [Justicia betacytorhabdovirus 1]
MESSTSEFISRPLSVIKLHHAGMYSSSVVIIKSSNDTENIRTAWKGWIVQTLKSSGQTEDNSNLFLWLCEKGIDAGGVEVNKVEDFHCGARTTELMIRLPTYLIFRCNKEVISEIRFKPVEESVIGTKPGDSLIFEGTVEVQGTTIVSGMRTEEAQRLFNRNPLIMATGQYNFKKDLENIIKPVPAKSESTKSPKPTGI